MSIEMWRRASVLLCVLLCLGVGSGAQTAGKVRVGIFPVLDASGEPHGERMRHYLAAMLYDELADSGNIQPVLLNPGGLYTSLSDDWVLDYGQTAGVDAVVVAMLMRSEQPKSGDWFIPVEVQFVELKTGKRAASQLIKTPVNKKDVTRGVEYGTTAATARAIERETPRSGWGGLFAPSAYAPSRQFEKQPMGKATRRLAGAAKAYAVTHAATVVPGASAAAAADGQTCDVKFRVTYAQRNAASKAYDVTINEREESLEVKDGVASVSLASGPVVVRVSVADAPFKLPVQRLYQASTTLDCRQPERTLALEIGAAGEALLRWRP